MKTKTYSPNDFIRLEVTGLFYNTNRRFKKVYQVEHFMYAFGINLWRGSVWGILKNGRKKLLKRVYN